MNKKQNSKVLKYKHQSKRYDKYLRAIKKDNIESYWIMNVLLEQNWKDTIQTYIDNKAQLIEQRARLKNDE